MVNSNSVLSGSLTTLFKSPLKGALSAVLSQNSAADGGILISILKLTVAIFDCVLPSRSGRTGQGLTQMGAVNLRNARHKSDPRPLDENCTCPCCQKYSRAYLHHTIKCNEIIGSMLLTWHNLHYYQVLMAGLREAISQNTLDVFVKNFHANRAQGDIAPL